jgi:hypothetical protein
MSIFPSLVFFIVCLTVYSPLSKTLLTLAGQSNYTSTLRDLLLISLGLYGIVRANPLQSPRLLWGVVILLGSIFFYIAISAYEDQYLPGLYYARFYALPVFFMMALAGSLYEATPRDKDSLIKATLWLNLVTVIVSIVLYGVMLADKGLASKLIVGSEDAVLLADSWYISGGTWMRMGLPATSPNNLGLILALNLYFCTVAARRVDGILKRMLPYAIALTFLALLLTFSRSSVLLYLVALALLLVFKDIHIPARTWGWAGTVGAIVLATGIAGIVAVNPDIADNVSHWIELNLSGDDPSMQGHIKTFKEAWERLPEYYLHGFEKGTVGPNAIFFTLSINHVENTILGVIYDMGFFLGFFFLLGWGLTLSHFHQQRRQYAAFWGFFVCSQFLPYFFGADALIVFAYLYALSGLMHDSRVST